MPFSRLLFADNGKVFRQQGPPLTLILAWMAEEFLACGFEIIK